MVSVFRHLLLLLLLGCSGCTLISLSTLGSLASLGDSSVSQGRDTYFFGKLKAAELASFDQARAAAKSAASDLGLRVKYPETLTKTRSEMAFVDDDGTQVGIRIDRRAGHLVRLRVDVGLFGSEPVERLFLKRMRVYMPEPPPTTMPTRVQSPMIPIHN